MYVITRKFSKHYDMSTETQFEPVLEQADGRIIGAAQVSDNIADYFAALHPLAGFQVLSDEDYFALVAAPAKENGPELVNPLTGDPLTDQSKKKADEKKPAEAKQDDSKEPLDGPPDPPKSS